MKLLDKCRLTPTVTLLADFNGGIYYSSSQGVATYVRTEVTDGLDKHVPSH